MNCIKKVHILLRQLSRSRNYCKHANLTRRDINFQDSKVPLTSVSAKVDSNLLPPQTIIDADTIAHLERLSLVDCANKDGIKTLESAIAFADQIHLVNTDDIQPLITVLEDRPLELREDVVTDGNCRKDILSNSSLTEEEYFVAPPGNIPLEPRKDLLHDNIDKP